MISTVFVLFYLLFPALILYITRVSKTAKKIGAVVFAYGIGLIIGNIGVMPHASEKLSEILSGEYGTDPTNLVPYLEQGLISASDLIANEILRTQNLMMNIVVPVAIPLLLFSLDIKRWLKLAKSALFSLFLGLVSLMIVICIGYFLFKEKVPEAWKIAGMLTGIYTGGTANLSAISTALGVNPNTFILVNTYDMVIGAFFLMFLLTSAQRTFNLFLPSFRQSHQLDLKDDKASENDDIENYQGMLTKKGIVQLLKGLGLSAIVILMAGSISLLLPESTQMVTIILGITTLGLVLSTIKSVNRIEKTFQLGMYFIIVFSLIVASMGDLRSMFSIELLYLFLFVLLAVFGSMLVHVFLSWIFKVDSDTTIVTITALTYSPPFVPIVAGALKNKEVIISGLTVGILGFAFGNYLGVAIAYFMHGF